jgi:disulfide bond formation protein DsbB
MPSEPDSPARTHDRAWMMLFAAWLIATIAMLTALFFSEVMRLPPCVLCWYQRICMFPLVLLLPLGMFPFDLRVVRYTLPLAAIGLLVALFHVLLVHGWIPEGIQPCRQGLPCDKNPIEWFGFLGIPDLSLAAFAAITALLIGARRSIHP